MSNNFLIQSRLLRAAIEKSFDILGQPAKMVILELMKKQGVDLDKVDKSYSLEIIKQTIEEAFDTNTAALILIRINQVLREYGDTERSTNNQMQDKSIIALTLTSKQLNYLYSAVSNMIADIEALDDPRIKFGGRGEYYIHELRENLPALQEMLLKILEKAKKDKI